LRSLQSFSGSEFWRLPVDRDQLFVILDFILNKATHEELQVIQEALKRREKSSGLFGDFGIHPKDIANEAAQQMSESMSYSIDSIRQMVRQFVTEMIQKEAPELNQKQVEELLNAWVPEPGGKEPGKEQDELPPDVLLQMIRQFLAYSTDSMAPSEVMSLFEEIPGWPDIYWHRFPERIRQIISLYLKGKIDDETCWEHIMVDLDISE
jgi:hypothetical protein